MTTRTITTTFNHMVDTLVADPAADRYGYEATERRYWQAYTALSQRDRLERLSVDTLMAELDVIDARRHADLDEAWLASRRHLALHGWC